jgi:hypothetical protein
MEVNNNVVDIRDVYRVNPAVKTDVSYQDKSVMTTYKSASGDYHIREVNYSFTMYDANGKEYTYSTSQVFDRVLV